MKTMKKRLIAILCCVAMLATSLYIAEPQKAEAAATSTMSITDADGVEGLQLGTSAGFLNWSYEGVASDYQYGFNFLDTAFITEYITFGGGMTAADLLDGLDKFYVANSTILQMNWSNRTTAFTAGWSFTISKDALLPYSNTSGVTSYMALDKEYTFTFNAGNDSYANIVRVDGYNVTTYSLNTTNLLPNGTADPFDSNIWFTLADTVEISASSFAVLDNIAYEDYVDVEGMTFSALKEAGAVMYAYLGANALQINKWGTLRDSLSKGDQIIFREGMPLYFTDTAGNAWKALLDGTYVYECMYDYTAQSEHDQVFDGAKINSENMFSMKTGNETVTNVEANFGFVWSSGSSQNSGYIEENILVKHATKPYIEYSGCTAEKLTTNNAVKLMFIPTANVLQIEVYDKTVLPAGAQIVLKEGMPITWNNGSHTLLQAELDNEYTLTVVSNDGTNVVISCTGSYSLSGTVTKGSDTNYETDAYFNMLFNTGDIPEDEEFAEGFTVGWDVLKDYFSLSGYTDEQIQNNITLKRYNISALRGLRVLYNVSNITFTEGMVMMFKKGLPISYTTPSSYTKTICLDKDYGFVYNASTSKFVYDETLGNDVEEVTYSYTANQTGDTSFWQPGTSDYRLTLGITLNPANSTEQYVDIMADTASYEYLDICGLDNAELYKAGVKLYFIPHASALQFALTADLSWLEVGDEIVLKSGLPVHCTYNGESVTATLTDDITYTITAASSTSVTVEVLAESAQFTLGSSEFGLNNHNDYGPVITICDPTTSEQTVLDDAQGVYLELDSKLVASYIDVAGMDASDLTNYNVKFRMIKDGNTEVLQMQVGTAVDALVIGDRITFKAGLPIQYTTTSGLKKTITLASDVVYAIVQGNSDNALIARKTTVQAGTWNFEYGVVNAVSGSGSGAEGYYNNIKLETNCEMMNEVSAMNYHITTEQMKKYVDFAGLNIATYGFDAYVIITNTDTVLQLRWGSTTPKIKEGDEIIFYAGLPVTATTTDGEEKVYLLENTVIFTVESHSDAANGFRLNSVQEESKAKPGDADGDFLLDINDVNLVREHLAELVSISDDIAVDVNEDNVIDAKDLVRAKHNFGDVAEKETYTLHYKNHDITTIVPANTTDTKAAAEAAGAYITIPLGDNGEGVSLGTDAYIRLTYKASENFRGYFVYSVNGGKDVEEEFYLEAGDSQFEQFLDVFRPNSINNGVVSGNTIVLKSIKLYNLSSNDANFVLYEVESAGRTVVTNDMLYIQSTGIKLGVDLNMGGTIAYMESLKHTVYEYLDTSSKEVIIGTAEQYAATSSKTALDTNGGVNLINIFDWGRQIQQSYYTYPSGAGDVDWAGNTFTPGTYNSNSDWPYNPVQAGDKNHNRSQIVDYRVIDTDGDGANDMIYVKVRAMEWASDVTNGETTDTYMENWYQASKALVYVDNNFVEWSGFNQSTKLLTQELPAFYVGQSLNTFVSDKNGVQQKDTNLGSWTEDGHYHNTTTTTDWYAFVNGEGTDAFGVGIYIPNVDATTAGRSKPTRRYEINIFNSSTWGATLNKSADEAPILDYNLAYINSMYAHEYQNCFLQNTSYIAPVCSGYMQGYKNYSYTYVLAADTLDNIDSEFSAIIEEGEITNTTLSNW